MSARMVEHHEIVAGFGLDLGSLLGGELNVGNMVERAPTFASRADFSRSCLSLASDSGTKWLQPSMVTSRRWATAGAGCRRRESPPARRCRAP